MPLTVDDGTLLPDVEAVLEKLRAGDAGQLERVARAHAPRMLASARRLAASEREAGEAVCAAFAEAARSSWRLQAGALGPTLRQLAVSAALGRLRERCGDGEATADELEPRFLADGHHESHPRDWGDPDEVIGRPGLAAEVRRAIARLPEDHRAALVLFDVEGLDAEAAARALGVSVAEARRRVHRARQALRALLAPRLRTGSP